MHQGTQNTLEQSKRKALTDSGQLRFVHWWTIASMLLVPVLAWRFLDNQERQQRIEHFQLEANQIVTRINDRLARYEEALHAGTAAIDMHGNRPSRAEWREFANTLRLDDRYPGINGIGLIEYLQRSDLSVHTDYHRNEKPSYRVYPEHTYDFHYPIVYIEPEAPNLQAIGLDMAHERHRREAAELARTTGKTQITGPIQLVQSNEITPGFLMFVPFFYDSDKTNADRTFGGMVYAPFIAADLVRVTIEPETRSAQLRIVDGNETLFDNHTERPMPEAFTRRIDIPIYGRTWAFTITSVAAATPGTTLSRPTMVLIGGLFFTALLIAMFTGMARANRHALTLAEQMTQAYRLKNMALLRSNSDLERFASLASHDLRTPLRGIASLTEYIEEDLNDYQQSEFANPDVIKNLNRMRNRIGRLDQLINGLLDYSCVGMTDDSWSEWSITHFAHRMRKTYELAPEQLIVSGSLQNVYIDELRINRVLEALISNAVKHHADQDALKVSVRMEHHETFYQFSIKDNGPGIDTRFEDKIFEPFETLTRSENKNTVGIGLAIARRTAESIGGTVTFESRVNQGCTFFVTWPRQRLTMPGSPEELAA
ncbi:MAG: CHASE domain-containing protein [Woeseiaceae bacterium]